MDLYFVLFIIPVFTKMCSQVGDWKICVLLLSTRIGCAFQNLVLTPQPCHPISLWRRLSLRPARNRKLALYSEDARRLPGTKLTESSTKTFHCTLGLSFQDVMECLPFSFQETA